MTKKLIKTLILFIVVQVSFAQKNKFPKQYLLDSNFMPSSKLSTSGYILEVDKFSDSIFQKLYYSQTTLKLLAVETYKNENDDVGNGLFGYYNSDGKLDSMGEVKNGKRCGDWLFYNPMLKRHDSVVKTITYDNNGKAILKTETASDKNYIYIEPSFKGDYIKFLNSNLEYPQTALNNGYQGKVEVKFTVNETGEISKGIFLQVSQNYFLDKEAIRVIKKSSGKWKPGIKDGNPITTYHIQPISFALSK